MKFKPNMATNFHLSCDCKSLQRKICQNTILSQVIGYNTNTICVILDYLRILTNIIVIERSKSGVIFSKQISLVK